MLQTVIAVPAPVGLDLCDLYPLLAPYGVTPSADAAFVLFVEEGEIRIKAEVAEDAAAPSPPAGLAEALADYAPPEPEQAPEPVPTYADLRREAYDVELPIGEQLDALAKGIDGPEWAAVVATRQAIKERFPKPDAEPPTE